MLNISCLGFFMKKIISLLCAISILFSVVIVGGCGQSKENRTEYSITATLDGHTLSAQMDVDFFNCYDNTIKELKFNLFANAFRKDAKYSPISAQYLSRAYPHGLSYGDMTINSVKCEEKELEFEVCGQDQNILAVNLQREIFPDERITVSIDYTLNLANVVARTGYNDNTINLANFYPILCVYDQNGFYECVYYSTGDPFYSQTADYLVTLTTDKDYVIASSGKVIGRESDGDKIKTKFKMQNVRSFAFVLSEKFDCVTDNSTGVEITYYYYDDGEPLKSIDYAVKSINTFNRLFGEYPYENYAVVQTGFVQGGMEFPALSMISDEIEGLPYGEVIVHETAHQWWQTAVGNNEIEYGFLDEGLAEYSVVLFYENFPEYGYTRESLVKSSEQTYKMFCSVYDKLFGKVNTSMLRSLKDFSSEYEYVNIAYIKPCIMYDTLRSTTGDERFFKALKRYFQNYKFLNATPNDLVGAFEKVGADTNGFFESFFTGKEII